MTLSEINKVLKKCIVYGRAKLVNLSKNVFLLLCPR